MYVLKKNKRTIKNATFDTYEKARQEARKRIRKGVFTQEYRATVGWDDISRNPPSISDFGYSISRAS